MKTSLILITLLSLISTAAFGKIVSSKGKYFIQARGEKTPLFMVNKLIEEKEIKKVKLYEDGRIHLISFAKKGEQEKLYSVDSDGFIYSIDPFASYTVDRVDANGRVQFKEAPGRKYHISSKGFFFY